MGNCGAGSCTKESSSKIGLAEDAELVHSESARSPRSIALESTLYELELVDDERGECWQIHHSHCSSHALCHFSRRRTCTLNLPDHPGLGESLEATS